MRILSSLVFAVTSTCSNVTPASLSRTFGSLKVNYSSSLHETHQSA